MRRLTPTVLLALAATLALHAQLAPPAAQPRPPFDVTEATIPQLQAALTDGRVTSRELVLLYLARIATYEDTVNAVMRRTPPALAK